MITSPHGRRFTQSQEWVPKSARCGWDEAKQLYFVYKDYRDYDTIGVGHLVKHGESFASGLTEAGVEMLFGRDLSPVEQAIAHHVAVPLTQNQFDALVDFGFNEGVGALSPDNCTFIRMLNRGYYNAPLDPAMGLLEWCKSHKASGGPLEIDAGLRRRREAECKLWSTPWAEEPEHVETALFDLVAMSRPDWAHA